jgi:hypothetical protein
LEPVGELNNVIVLEELCELHMWIAFPKLGCIKPVWRMVSEILEFPNIPKLA